MVNYTLVYAKQAQKDAKKISRSNLKQNATELLNILNGDPFKKPPEYEALVGDLQGAYSRRINIQQRIVYQVLKEEKVVKVIRMWTHMANQVPTSRDRQRLGASTLQVPQK